MFLLLIYYILNLIMSRLASISNCILCGDGYFTSSRDSIYCSDTCESNDYPRIEMRENIEELKENNETLLLRIANIDAELSEIKDSYIEMRNSITSLSADISVVANQVNLLANTLNEIIKNKSL
jgi:chromosome segregation ATPase